MYRSQPLSKFAGGVRSYLRKQKCRGRRSLSSSRICHGNYYCMVKSFVV
jgi:hypothetical protein